MQSTIKLWMFTACIHFLAEGCKKLIQQNQLYKNKLINKTLFASQRFILAQALIFAFQCEAGDEKLGWARL
jgi:hypothetical protein